MPAALSPSLRRGGRSWGSIQYGEIRQLQRGGLPVSPQAYARYRHCCSRLSFDFNQTPSTLHQGTLLPAVWTFLSDQKSERLLEYPSHYIIPHNKLIRQLAYQR